MNNFYNSVSEWFKWAFLEKKGSKPFCLEIEYILGTKLDPLVYLKKGILLYDELIRLCEEANILNEYMPLMAIPLKCSDEVFFFNKETFDFVQELDTEPPSLYLIERDSCRYYKASEEYKCPITLENYIRRDDCISYYQCSRTKKEMEYGWEFARCIYIKHYTKEFILSQ